MAKSPYTDSTPVDEPTSPEKKKPAAKASKGKPVQYPDSVPVPDPVTYAKGGSIDGIAQRGKTRGKIC
jgi:hypothetical protein